MCFKFWHKWRCVKVSHYLDNSYDEPGCPSTTAIYVCTKCNKAKEESFYNGGYLTVSELNQAE